MKKLSILSIVMVFSLLLVSGVFAAGYDQQSASGGGNDMQGMSRGADLQSNTTRGTMDNQTAAMDRAAMGRRAIDRASKIIGMDVNNPQGEKLGDIKDLAVDDTTGQVAYAVLGAGGILGVGEKYFAIPWKALSFSADGKNLVLNMDKDRLKNAPGFSKNNWPDFANKQWGSEVYRYYGVTPYWEMRSGSSSSTRSSSGSSY